MVEGLHCTIIFKPQGLKSSMIVFGTKDFLPSLEKDFKSNQVQKTKVNDYLLYLLVNDNIVTKITIILFNTRKILYWH